ncbi:YecA family protein [Alkaliphilus hydrothermalis]|uniref:SEC-C motif-containing protein n=1 Tax=Alkaliphilus hydrothermalis TaxID=1482730 RepID=A0ABS2NTN5_9FIRM|nr:SEC-C metal-binding domain-containing protein [Alkaliphilus hydrothermalis]MBM7615939.1 hypothetical protein [Alkaliphilus hydrothermalis]
MTKEFDDAMNRMAQNVEKRIVKACNKLYGSIKKDDSFENYLDGLTKAELDNIRRNIGLKGVSQFSKKKLILVLAEELPVQVEQLLLMCGNGELKLIKQLVKNNGRLTIAEEHEYEIDILRKKGLCFSGTFEDGSTEVFIPIELLDPILQVLDSLAFNKQIKTINEILQVVNGIIFYYGILTIDELYDYVVKILGKEIDYNVFVKIIENDDVYESEFVFTGLYVHHLNMNIPEEILMEHYSRGDLPYYPLTLKQALEAGKSEYEEINRHDLRLMAFLDSHYELSKIEALDEIKILKDMIRNLCPPGELLEYFQQFFEIPTQDELQMILDMIIGIYNNTRQWVLKGHTSTEIRGNHPLVPQEQPEAIKVGRNDTCPCGSGKKYKKCCGR